MCIDVSKSVFRASCQVRFKSACSATNQPAELQRLAKIVIFCLLQVWLFYFLVKNDKGLDHAVQMPKLVCVFVVLMQQNQVFRVQVHLIRWLVLG